MRRTNTSARLATAFATQRTGQLDLLPVAIVMPELTEAPTLDKHGTLQLKGTFVSGSRLVEFQLNYQPVGGIWRVSGISIATKEIALPKPGSDQAKPKAKPKAKPRANKGKAK